MARRRTHRKGSKPAPKVDEGSQTVFMTIRFSRSEIERSVPQGPKRRGQIINKNRKAYNRKRKHRGRGDY
jgi:hypothetical protein